MLRESLELSFIQRQVVIGTVLGDGCLTPNVWGKHYRLQIEHGAEQKRYCFWKYEVLKNFVLTPPRIQQKRNSWRFRTVTHPEFTVLAKQWYGKDGRKHLPQGIIPYIGMPIVLAVWYMDDGGLRVERGKIYGAFLNTQSFSWDENVVLRKSLRDSYEIETLLLLNHGKPRMYIPRRSLSILRNVIEPYIQESMRYKLP
jgi:hypothetical protein